MLPAPEALEGIGGQLTLINQVGWAGIHLGRIDDVFSRKNKRIEQTTSVLLPVRAPVRSSS